VVYQLILRLNLLTLKFQKHGNVSPKLSNSKPFTLFYSSPTPVSQYFLAQWFDSPKWQQRDRSIDGRSIGASNSELIQSLHFSRLMVPAMSLIFLLPMSLSLVIAVISQQSSDDLAEITGLAAIVSLILSLVLAPWQLQLFILLLMSTRALSNA
jgi:hypothetical protein